MPASGDIAVLQCGVDGHWHWVFLTPSTLSTFQFNSGATTPVLVTLGTQMVADTGWTGNTDVGDKTKVIGSTASLVTIQGLLNTLAAGSGDAFLAMAQKIKALEIALLAGKLPNA